MQGTERLHRIEGRSSLREQVAEAVRAGIVAGEMPPGVVYSVPALAERFGVSATPVREALLDLAKEGLLEAVRNKGWRVTRPSEHDLDEIYEIRALLEVPAIGRLVGRVGMGDLKSLRGIAREIESAARSGDLIAYIEADRRFHLDLLALLGNRRLVEIVAALRSQARLFGLAPLAADGRLVHAAKEHSELLRHLAAGDTAAAQEVMARHLRHTRGIWAGANRGEQRNE